MVKRVKLFIMSCLLAIMQILPLFQPAVVYAEGYTEKVYAEETSETTFVTGEQFNIRLKYLVHTSISMNDTRKETTSGNSIELSEIKDKSTKLDIEDISDDYTYETDGFAIKQILLVDFAAYKEQLSDILCNSCYITLNDSGQDIYACYHDGIVYVFTEASEAYLNEDSSYMFAYMVGLENTNLFQTQEDPFCTINGTNCSNVDNMYLYDQNLKYVDMHVVEFSSALSAENMFRKTDNMKYFFAPIKNGDAVEIKLPAEMHEDTDTQPYDLNTMNEDIYSEAVIDSEIHSYFVAYKVAFSVEGNMNEISPQYVCAINGFVNFDNLVSENTVHKKEGYTFTGDWYASTGQSAWSKYNAVTSPMVLQARYVLSEYDIEYDANAVDVTGEMDASHHIYHRERDVSVSSDAVSDNSLSNNSLSGSSHLAFNQFVRKGYIFDGWNTQPDGTGTAYLNGEDINLEIIRADTSPVRLYAQWSRIHYTVVFDGNGASSGDNDPLSMTYGEAETLSANGFIKNGYKFIGWSLSPNGPVTYQAGNEITNLSTVQYGTVKMYAMWEPVSYSIVYHSGTENGNMDPQTMKYDKPAILEANKFVYPGYTFAGWSKAPNSTLIAYTDKEEVENLCSEENAEYHLYAVWEANTNTPYTVKNYFMDAQGSYPSIPVSIKKTGTTDTIATAELANFNTDEYISPAKQSVKITGDGSAVIAYYYPRRKYTLTLSKGDNTKEVIGAGSYYWGSEVTIDAEPISSTPVLTYVFQDWTGYQYSKTKKFMFKMPSFNINMKAACREKDLYTYQKYSETSGKYKIYSGSTATDSEYDGYSDRIKTKRKQGQSITQFPFIVKEGYNLNGWYTAAVGGTKVDKNTPMPDTTTSYYAQWSPHSYRISFQNGSAETNVKGSFPSVINGVKYDSSSAIAINASNAQAWRGTITFKSNAADAKIDTSSVAGQTTQTGPNITLVRTTGTANSSKAEIKTYSTTLKWTTGRNGSGWGSDSKTNNSLKYKKAGMSYGNNNGGKGSIAAFAGGSIDGTVTNLIQGYEYQNNDGGTLTLYAQYSGCTDLTTPKVSRRFYNFLGWFNQVTGGSRFAGEEEVKSDQTGNKTYYAQWDPWDITIRFDKNSSYPTDASTTPTGSMSDQILTYAKTNRLNSNHFSRTGYLFTGWNTKADGSGISITDNRSLYNVLWTPKSEGGYGLATTDWTTITLYAQWKPITYTVKYHKNDGGYDETTSSTFTFDREYTLNSGYSRASEGYTLDGWGYSESGSSSYGNGAPVRNLASTQGGVVHLYAKWTWHPAASSFYWEWWEDDFKHRCDSGTSSDSGDIGNGNYLRATGGNSGGRQHWDIRGNNRNYSADRQAKMIITDVNGGTHGGSWHYCSHGGYQTKHNNSWHPHYVDKYTDWEENW